MRSDLLAKSESKSTQYTMLIIVIPYTWLAGHGFYNARIALASFECGVFVCESIITKPIYSPTHTKSAQSRMQTILIEEF